MLSQTELFELQTQIGINEELTDKVLLKIKSLDQSSDFFTIYNLLLLERYDNTLPLITLALNRKMDINYLHTLQTSKYYILRKSACQAIRSIDFPEKKDFLRRSLNDPIVQVVKEATESILQSNIFTEEELLEVAIELFNNKYTTVKMLSIDIIHNIPSGSFFIADLIKANNWRIRIKLANCVNLFKTEEQNFIIDELKSDSTEEVRIELSKNLYTLDHLELLHDESSQVRANYLTNIIQKIQEKNILRGLINDESWEVKKILLHLENEMFKEISIPLIKKEEDVCWRTRHEIICLLETKIKDEFIMKLMTEYLLKNMTNITWQIRQKCQEILLSCIERYEWMEDWKNKIIEIVESKNYLFRISVVPIALAFDLKFNSNISLALINDPVINVRDFYNEYFNTLNNIKQ